jgi:hypothetical protein
MGTESKIAGSRIDGKILDGFEALSNHVDNKVDHHSDCASTFFPLLR